MITHRHHTRRPSWWRFLRPWQRALLVIFLLGAMALSAALIYFQPGTLILTQPGPAPASTEPTVAPEYAPGTRWYYRRSQWEPLDQQP